MTILSALSAEEISKALQELPQWRAHNNAIERVVKCPGYRAGLDLLYAIGELAERENHHPDLALDYTTLTVRYWTHTAHGVTHLDLSQAMMVEALIRQVT